jgi:acetyl-CoA carboxylase biotin carboxylase subunit
VTGDEFAFIEVNCRIQVEHPVTEMVTGLDLVREQLRAAAGLPLSLSQAEIRPHGVAIECRINAEDPGRDFAPCSGELTEFMPPGGPFVRVDTHAYPGWRIPPDYDSLLAKVIAWAPDRDQALDRLNRALTEFRIAGPGVHTTVGLGREILADPIFRAGRHTTTFLSQLRGPAVPPACTPSQGCGVPPGVPVWQIIPCGRSAECRSRRAAPR